MDPTRPPLHTHTTAAAELLRRACGHYGAPPDALAAPVLADHSGYAPSTARNALAELRARGDFEHVDGTTRPPLYQVTAQGRRRAAADELWWEEHPTDQQPTGGPVGR